MPTYDLHFHANVYGLSRRTRDSRLERIRRTLSANRLDCLASTEHSYKNPLEAYLHLAETAADLETTVIPGVEGVSSEGIDIIYLFRCEDQLRRSLRSLRSFGWSVRDVAAIARNTGAITIVPHPFHICRSAAGNVLSSRAYSRLLAQVDYVEIHNGSALPISTRLGRSRSRPLFKKTMGKLHKTIDLPMRHRGQGVGWAIGSDAHYPEEQLIVGFTPKCPADDESHFDFLRRRQRFETYHLENNYERSSFSNFGMLRSVQAAFREGIIKECVRTMTRANTIISVGGCYKLLSLFSLTHKL